MIYENEYGTVNFMDERPTLFKRKKIGVNLSGGTDSTFLMFATLREISEKNLETQVIPVTGVDSRRPTNEWHVIEIMEYFKELFPNVNIGEHQFDYYTKKSMRDKSYHHELHENKLFLEGTIDILFHGVTANPSEEEMKEFGFFDDREIKRDKSHRNYITAKDRKPITDTVVPNFLWYAPFAYVNKKFIAAEYEKHGLMDELFEMTSSCIGDKFQTNGFSEPCKKCWWCKEKHWAFGVYDGGIK